MITRSLKHKKTKNWIWYSDVRAVLHFCAVFLKGMRQDTRIMEAGNLPYEKKVCGPSENELWLYCRCRLASRFNPPWRQRGLAAQAHRQLAGQPTRTTQTALCNKKNNHRKKWFRWKVSEQPTRKFSETVSCSCLRSKVCHNLLQNRKKNQAYLNYDYLICVNLIISHKWWSPWGNDLRKETVQLKCRSDRCDALAKWLSDNLFARELLWIPCGWFRKCFTIHYDM